MEFLKTLFSISFYVSLFALFIFPIQSFGEGVKVSENETLVGIAEFFKIYRIQISLLIAMGVVALIFIIIIRILRETKNDKFFDIILDEDWYPSLPRFQIFIWTIVILFAFLWVYLSRIIGGTVGIGDFPYNLMILMGVSSTTYAISKKASDMKYGNPTIPTPRPAKPHPYRSMLYEGNKKSLTRIQYFAWTWIGIVIYLLLLTLEITYTTDFSKLDVSNIPPILVLMMGIGQGAFIGGKFMSIKDFQA